MLVFEMSRIALKSTNSGSGPSIAILIGEGGGKH